MRLPTLMTPRAPWRLPSKQYIADATLDTDTASGSATGMVMVADDESVLDDPREVHYSAARHSFSIVLSGKDVRRGLFLSPPKKKHRSVPTKILLPDTFLRCDTQKKKKKNKGNYTNLTDVVFVRQDAKTVPRSTVALDRRWFFQVTAELQRMPIDSSASVFVYSTLLYFRVFFISAECPSRLL